MKKIKLEGGCLLHGDCLLEIWSWVRGYRGLYKVSTYGRVKSIARVMTNKNGHIYRVRSRLLKPIKSIRGYSVVFLFAAGQQKCANIGRLVAQAFIPNPLKREVINHKDGNKRNNLITNLEWVTVSENNQHAIDNGLRSPACKFSDSDVNEIRNMVKLGKLQKKDIALKIGISRSHMRAVLRGRYRRIKNHE